MAYAWKTPCSIRVRYNVISKSDGFPSNLFVIIFVAGLGLD